MNRPIPNVGAWLGSDGPESDVVVASRVRLARNLANVPFLTRASTADQDLVIRATELALADAGLLEHGRFYEPELLTPEQGQYLLERHLVSPDFARSHARRGLYLTSDETKSLMVNEEDHLRLQVLGSGLALTPCLDQATDFDRQLEARLHIASSPEFGYLTACPTNLGTGLRASVLIHLPALVLTREIEKVLRGAIAIGLNVRGIYGEGTDTRGNFFQISNARTLGQTEPEIVEIVATAARQLIDYERKARAWLMRNLRLETEDKVFRSLGLLRSARLLTSDEAINLLATVRLGICLGIINELDLGLVTRLLVLVRPANLQQHLGQTLDSNGRDERRATFLRELLVS